MLTETLGILGLSASCLLFLALLPTAIDIYQAKDAQGYNHYSSLAMLMCSTITLMWAASGVAQQGFMSVGYLFPICCNTVGFVLSIFYLTIFGRYKKKSRERRAFLFEVGSTLGVLFCVFLCVELFSIFPVAGLGANPGQRRTSVFGLLSAVTVALMYLSPLASIGETIRTQSVRYQSLSLAIGNLIAPFIWGPFGFLVHDPVIWTPNTIGILSGIVQLVVYAYYRGMEDQMPTRARKSVAPIGVAQKLFNDKATEANEVGVYQRPLLAGEVA